MEDIVSFSKEAKELRQELEKAVEENRMTKESINCGIRTVRQRGSFFKCTEIHDDYMDLDGNLVHTIIEFKGIDSGYLSFYINSYENDFISTV